MQVLQIFVATFLQLRSLSSDDVLQHSNLFSAFPSTPDPILSVDKSNLSLSLESADVNCSFNPEEKARS